MVMFNLLTPQNSFWFFISMFYYSLYRLLSQEFIHWWVVVHNALCSEINSDIYSWCLQQAYPDVIVGTKVFCLSNRSKSEALKHVTLSTLTGVRWKKIQQHSQTPENWCFSQCSCHLEIKVRTVSHWLMSRPGAWYGFCCSCTFQASPNDVYTYSICVKADKIDQYD